MKIVIPTTRSDLMGGKETYVRDVALGLSRRGHQVAVLSNLHGPGIRSMGAEGVLVCEDPGNLPFLPDIIHGQANLETLQALSLFPDTPAFYQVHGAGPLGNPLPHPRIYRYGGMTESIVTRVAIEIGIPLSATVVIRNSIDPGRFATVREPAVRLRRALLYSSYHHPGSETFAAVRAASLASGMDFDTIGRPFSARIENPEDVLPTYDLVFAAGLSAMEALSCGCAVVVLGMTSCGPLIDLDNLDYFIASNFALPFNAVPADEGAIRAEIARFRPERAAEVTRLVRIACDGRAMLDQLLGVYGEIIDDHRRAPPPPDEERAAVAAVLKRMTPLAAAVDAGERSAMPLTRELGIEMCGRALVPLASGTTL